MPKRILILSGVSWIGLGIDAGWGRACLLPRRNHSAPRGPRPSGALRPLAFACKKALMAFLSNRLPRFARPAVLMHPSLGTNKKAHRSCDELFYWCPGTESNRRHTPFQGVALPTELPGHYKMSEITNRCGGKEKLSRSVFFSFLCLAAERRAERPALGCSTVGKNRSRSSLPIGVGPS
jgi:hypothetical protein